MDGEHPTRVDIINVDGVPAGFLQHYRAASYPDYADTVGDHEAIAIDYAIGDPALTGIGIGPQAIWCYIRDVVMPLHPDVPRILATPEVSNARSIRTLQKVGFRHLRDVAGEALCVMSLAHIFGQRPDIDSN